MYVEVQGTALFGKRSKGLHHLFDLPLLGRSQEGGAKIRRDPRHLPVFPDQVPQAGGTPSRR